MLTGLHHTGIVVEDIEQMVRFYTEDLGMRVLLELDSVAPPEGNHTGIPGARRKRYVDKLGLSDYDAGVLTGSRDVADFFEAVLRWLAERMST